MYWLTVSRFLLGSVTRRLRREGFCGVVSFSDDVPRLSGDGKIVHAGHLGIVCQALGAAFLNRGTPAKLYLLPDGTVFSNRTISKIRAGDTGWRYGANILEGFGAAECPSDYELRRHWLDFWLSRLTRRLSYPGNLKYAWSFSRTIKLRSFPYPKVRVNGRQGTLNFGEEVFS